ncbi:MULTISPECIES: hypothetical protein [Aeromonas]|uniref:hypothetical protein n=1 Tax=Aeromonas TaxID=642 RepID=UPI002B499F0E|nr:hypothetical protein [Aeromonas veronii]
MDLNSLNEHLFNLVFYGVVSGIGAFFGSYLKRTGDYKAQIENTDTLRKIELKVDKLFSKKERYELLISEKIEVYAQLIFDIHATFAIGQHAYVIEEIERNVVFEKANKAVLIQKMYFPELKVVTERLFDSVTNYSALYPLCFGETREYDEIQTRREFSIFEKEIISACNNAIDELKEYINNNINIVIPE